MAHICTHHPHNLAWTPPHKAKVVYQTLHTQEVFFLPELRSGVHRGDPYGVPLCTYEHPVGVLIPDPYGVRLRYVTQTPSGFVYRTP